MQLVYHKSVMCREIFTYLQPKPGQIFVDCTLGSGGHAEQILNAIVPGGRLIGIDQDLEALKTAGRRLEKFGSNVTLVHDNFENLSSILEKCRIEKIDGILFDLGLSSLQIESKTRGFSFQYDSVLDMRMNQDNKITAFDLINHLTEDEIAKIIRNYGEDPWARKIARLIVQERKKNPLSTTFQLVEVISKAVSYKTKSKIHPATRTFQSFRIAVNRELEVLEKALETAVEFLNLSGRICVISFHSLEDRIVKNVFKKKASQKKIKILTKKPLFATEQEIGGNLHARSARLRTAERNGVLI